MTLDRKIPDWLAPHKNEWRSLATMRQLFTCEGRSLQTWLLEIKPRLRCVEKPSPNGVGVARYYLVKQVWACALAHGIKLSQPVPVAVSETEDLRQEIAGLRFQLARANQKKTVKPAAPDAIRMLSAMLMATEPRPLPGVYFLISAGVVTYVGQSQNVLARMSGHIGKSFDTVKMIHEPEPGARMAAESRWISAFQPRDNIKGLDARKVIA